MKKVSAAVPFVVDTFHSPQTLLTSENWQVPDVDQACHPVE